MEKRILGRGLLAGALAGVFAFIFARIFVEPVIGRAIDFEDGTSAAHEAMETAAGHGHSHGDGAEVFTRSIQANFGLGFGVLAFSVAMGALLAVVFCVVYGRTKLSARALSAIIAGGMLVSVWIVPALKYPPNPPAVSSDDTITQRTLLYVVVLVLSVGLMLGATLLTRRLLARFDLWNATLLGAAAYVLSMAVVFVLLPSIDETPGPMRDSAGNIVFEGFPADDLYEFRLYALATQVLIWVTIGLVFGALATRVLEGKRQPQELLT